MGSKDKLAKEGARKIAKIEDQALESWQKLDEPPLTIEEGMYYYEHYLNGWTLSEIAGAHGGAVCVGKLADARERYDWDERKRDQISGMFSAVQDKVIKSKVDSISHLADMLAVAHKKMGSKMKKYLVTGDEEILGKFDPSSVKDYSTILQTLQTLTEAAKNTKDVMVNGTVEHKHSVSLKPDEKSAAKLLELLESGQIIDVE